MKPATHPDALRVQSVLGPAFRVVEFDSSTKTSADAAAAVGCAVGQIAKSIVFKTVKDQQPVLVIASGTNRVDEKKVSALLGEKVKSCDADFVMAHAGFAAYNEIWAAAGTANSVFKLTWEDLVMLTQGMPGDVAKITLQSPAGV
jgi:prolyl-tRNA editing enzyme YbaK/EbsC (Cys-tRNA(Pro) deacylase)